MSGDGRDRGGRVPVPGGPCPGGGPCPRGSLSRGVPVLGPSLGSRPCGAQDRVPAGVRGQVTAEQLRARGNALFQAGDHGAALAAYTEALSLSDAASERAVLHRNRAACYLKLVSAGRVRHRGAAGTCPAG